MEKVTERNKRGSNQNRKADKNTEYDINLLNERSYLQQHIEPVWLESEINLPIKYYSIRLYGTRRPIKDYDIKRPIENYYINSMLDEDHDKPLVRRRPIRIGFAPFRAPPEPFDKRMAEPQIPGWQPIDEGKPQKGGWWWWWKSTND